MSIFEPNQEAGKVVRWKIGMANGDPLAIAGLWRQWKDADGSQALAFTMLTVNAAEHPLMNRFHKPVDEKRSVVIVPTKEHANWLSCTSAHEARSFLATLSGRSNARRRHIRCHRASRRLSLTMKRNQLF
jgi:putative SOS response-associated peptidase YedK